MKSKSRSKSKAKDKDLEYADDLAEEGAVEWEEPDSLEEEDMFNPRHLEDEGDPKGDEEAWAEEDRIAAIVRERDEWDKL